MVLVQAKEFGEAEVWMNERLMRVAPSSFAKFVTAFEEQNQVVVKPGTQQTRQETLLWLVSSSLLHLRQLGGNGCKCARNSAVLELADEVPQGKHQHAGAGALSISDTSCCYSSGRQC